MATWDKGKGNDPHTLPTVRGVETLRSGAYPSAIADGGDTDPMSVAPGSMSEDAYTDDFDEGEITRAEAPRFVADVTDAHAYGAGAAEPSEEHAVAVEHERPSRTPPAAATQRDMRAASWDLDDVAGYWDRLFAIEGAGNESDDALARELRKHGLRDKAHFDETRERFQQHYGDDPAFMQAGIDSRMRQSKNIMLARMDAVKDDLGPVEGITLEQWAWLMAKIASGGNPAELLKLAKLEDAKWQRVSAEWNDRMSRDKTAAIATAYGQAFVASGPGPFAEAAKAVGAVMLDPSKREVGAGPPVPMEKWIEISEAQSAAAQRGEDPSALLASFGLTPADWGVIGGWWGQHFTANAMKLMGEYNRLSELYKRKYAG